MDKLTPKQERFCIEYFKCGNASQAYRIAYDAEKMADATINRKAFDVLANGKVTARLDELKRKVEKRTLITKERGIEILTEIAEASQDKDRIGAVKQLSKILGWEAPKVTRQTIDVLSPWERFCEESQKSSNDGD